MIKSEKGITLTELLVVAGIIMTLSAITIPNWNRGGERLKVTRAAHQLNQDIRRAQELTLANTDFEECDTTHGYGLYLKPRENYVLFAECDAPDGEYDEISDGKKEEVNLEEGVKITRLITPDGSDTNNLTVTFEPPEPTVTIKDSDGDSLEEATIELTNDGFCRQVRTNKTGLVDLDECE